MVWITIPESKKLKNPWFLNSFSPTPPPKARMPKYLRPDPTSGGTLALSSSGGHPGPGVNVLLILDNFPAKNTKNGSGAKDFQIEDIPKIIPMLRGLFLDFWSLNYFCTLQYLLFETRLAAPPKSIFYLKPRRFRFIFRPFLYNSKNGNCQISLVLAILPCFTGVTPGFKWKGPTSPASISRILLRQTAVDSRVEVIGTVVCWLECIFCLETARFQKSLGVSWGHSKICVEKIENCATALLFCGEPICGGFNQKENWRILLTGLPPSERPSAWRQGGIRVFSCFFSFSTLSSFRFFPSFFSPCRFSRRRWWQFTSEHCVPGTGRINQFRFWMVGVQTLQQVRLNVATKERFQASPLSTFVQCFGQRCAVTRDSGDSAR